MDAIQLWRVRREIQDGKQDGGDIQQCVVKGERRRGEYSDRKEGMLYCIR